MNTKLQQAFAHHQRGELVQAEGLYREFLGEAPGHGGALHMLGLAQYQQGRPRDAAEAIRAALVANPREAPAHSNLALALQALRDFSGALASCDAALALNPDYAEAHNNRGNALHALHRDTEALASYDRALAIAGDYADAFNNRGAVLVAMARFDDALASCDRALALRPGHPNALTNRADALLGLDRPQDALACYDRVLALDPGRAEIHQRRGDLLAALKRPLDALASFDRSLALRRDDVYVLNRRISMLLELRRPKEALATCDQLLALDPDNPDSLANRGNVLYTLKRFADAAEAFARVVAVAPAYDYAIGIELRCRQMCCDWTVIGPLTLAVERAVDRGDRAAVPFSFLVVSRSPAAQLRCARTFVADRFPPSPRPIAVGHRSRHEKIRIAYLSTKYHDHAGAYLAAGLFEAHDRTRFETTAISFGPHAQGGIRDRLVAAFDRFVDVRTNSDREVAQILAAAQIDIAIDLTGHATDSRAGILAMRPAPIQVNYLGFPGTLGADYIDYIVADRWVIPKGDEAFYAEKVVRLPDAYQVNDRKRRIAEHVPTRTDAGLPPHAFVFCCFNNNYKIAPDVFDVWMRLLLRVEGSVLWLLEDNAAASANLRREAEARGVAADRLVFAPRADLADHLARHRLADLFIDTLPYTAHTTASDALWTGLPVVTCLGSTFAGRVAASLLDAAGLPDLITRDLDAYETLALDLARSPDTLAAVRSRLAANALTCPLFDTDRSRRHLEAAYTTMWARHQRGESPAGFDVVPVD